ncbi:MAG: transglutaminase domain-containing protein [Nitrospirae bacterium]|nr:transglutaminase domain-containing protein [Nitrospirota bacterium]
MGFCRHRPPLPSSPCQGEDGRGGLSALPDGSFQIALANPPTSADLAENGIEIVFTPAITAKVAELGYKPVKIYEWVRNNIEYVPTYGSIQGADMCLQTKLCNDFDTASLLISLLRVSGIHARYVYGTIELPIDKVKNWVGGFTDSNATLSLMATGGIPVGGITEDGKIVAVRKEHIWVEAFIDYFPMRGVRHKTGEGDTWIPLDASFKQYTYTSGMDIKSAVPFDAQSFVTQIQSTATINEQAGYVTNVNSLYIQQAMQDYQSRVQSYISQNHPNATVGDILGKKEIVKQEFSYLLGTLPYKKLVTGTKYSTLPDSLRHKASFSMLVNNLDYEMQITRSLPELAGKKITLSYSPATQADENVINSYLPKPHTDGTPIQPNELPSSLPAYLITLKPELRIDGVVMATGSPVTMGQDEFFNISISAPTTATHSISNKVTAGEFNAIALDIARITPEQMTALKTKLEVTKAKLETQNFTGLTKDDILGDLLYTTVLSYFAELDATDFVTAKTMGVISTRLPSVGRFFNSLAVDYIWGVPVKTSTSGLSMDIGLIRKLVKAPDGAKEKQIQFMLNSGMNSSALEHSVPEQLFSTLANPAQGISAVKALQLANDQGIPIYKIDQSNIAAILPQLQLSPDTITDIQNAVGAGKMVTVSKTNITFNGWTGCGYIITDPNTGAGAYMISGGMNGAMLLCALMIGSCAAVAAALLMIAVATVELVIYLLISLLVLLLALIVSILIAFGPFILQYLVLYSLCGPAATHEYIKCLLWMVGIHLGIDGVAALIKKLPSILAANAAKYLHHIGFYVAGGEIILCVKDLLLSCNDNR